MVMVACQRCGKEFYVKPSHKALGCGKFCSRACHHEDKRKGEYKACEICGTVTYKQKKALQNSKSGKFFCGKQCQTKWRNSVYIGKKHKNYIHGTYSYREVMKRADIDAVCSVCSTRDERILAVHHIDHNRKNNTVENLVYLCHNCHHLVHYYNVKF